jgi:hypothetical protein
MPGTYYGGTDFGSFGAGMSTMGAGAYGISPNGNAAMGPYSFLPGAQGGGAGGQAIMPTAGSIAAPGQGVAGAGLSDAGSSFLNGVVNGQNLPYSQQQQDTLYASASASNAQAEQEQNNQARSQAAAGGASPNDPSLSSVTQQDAARRQGANQTALGDIQSQAHSANFGAQAGAATGLMNADLQQQAINQRGNQFQQNLGFQQSQSAQRMLGGMFGGGGQQSFQYGPGVSQSNMGIEMGGGAF